MRHDPPETFHVEVDKRWKEATKIYKLTPVFMAYLIVPDRCRVGIKGARTLGRKRGLNQ